MSSAIEVLKKDIISYEEIRKSGKKCLTTNNEECCFVHYPEIKEALLALEKQENYVIDFIRLEVLPKSKKEQFRVFFKDGTEQVFQKERIGEQK